MKEVIQVTQFFEYEGMDCNDLKKGKEKGVLPSTDEKVFLWSENPKIKQVEEVDQPICGYVWLAEEDGKVVVYKANYDSSD